MMLTALAGPQYFMLSKTRGIGTGRRGAKRRSNRITGRQRGREIRQGRHRNRQNKRGRELAKDGEMQQAGGSSGDPGEQKETQTESSEESELLVSLFVYIQKGLLVDI